MGVWGRSPRMPRQRLCSTGKVFVQTRNPSNLAWFLHPFRPIKQRIEVGGDD
jgi:hypothetical protein